MDIALPVGIHKTLVQVLEQYRKPGQIEFHAVRTRQAGNRKFMEFHLLVPGAWTVQRGHDFTEEVIDSLVSEVPEMRVSAHLEPIEDPKSYADETDF